MIIGKIIKFFGIGIIIASIILCTSIIINDLGADVSFVSFEFLLMMFFFNVLTGTVTYAFGVVVQNSCRMTEILESLANFSSDNV